jgi:hypothetical protein
MRRKRRKRRRRRRRKKRKRRRRRRRRKRMHQLKGFQVGVEEEVTWQAHKAWPGLSS